MNKLEELFYTKINEVGWLKASQQSAELAKDIAIKFNDFINETGWKYIDGNILYYYDNTFDKTADEMFNLFLETL